MQGGGQTQLLRRDLVPRLRRRRRMRVGYRRIEARAMVERRWTKRILVEVSNRSSWLIAAWPSGHRLVEFGRNGKQHVELRWVSG